MTPPADPSTLSPSEKDALIAALLARVKALLEEVEGLRTENAALRDKLSLPPKTPRNSSKPPSQEMKANGETEPKPKSKPHAGAYRPLHPNPTRCREVWADCCPQCQADVTAVAQVPLHTYDWIEIPEITPWRSNITQQPKRATRNSSRARCRLRRLRSHRTRPSLRSARMGRCGPSAKAATPSPACPITRRLQARARCAWTRTGWNGQPPGSSTGMHRKARLGSCICWRAALMPRTPTRMLKSQMQTTIGSRRGLTSCSLGPRAWSRAIQGLQSPTPRSLM